MLKKTAILLSGLLLTLSAFANIESHQVVDGERLVQILRINDYGEEYRDLIPFIEETLRLNPDAFKNGDVNHIIPGTTIRLPENPNKVTVEEVVEPEPEPVEIPEPEPVVISEPAPEIIGKLSPTSGHVRIQRDEELIAVEQETPLIENDVIMTRENSKAEIRLTDQSRFTLGPKSTFSIDQYAFKETDSAQNSLITTIHQGFLRAITGLIGKLNTEDYQVKSNLTVTIGVRGTDFTVRSCIEQATCGDLYGVSVAVQDGGISFENAAGSINLDTNQFTQIETANDIPEPMPIPDGYFDLELSPSEIEVPSSWWDRVLDWLTDLF